MKIGLIADTHGLLRPEALAALRGAAHVLHAGDVGDSGILAELARIAPTTAIRGNVDVAPPLSELPDRATLHFGRHRIHMLHDLNDLGADPAGRGWQVVVAGHSHRPEAARRDGVLYVNPGSAGPRRFRLPVSVAWLDLGGAEPAAEIVALQV